MPRNAAPIPAPPQQAATRCSATRLPCEVVMVPRKGLEPSRLAARAPEARASTNSATWALNGSLMAGRWFCKPPSGNHAVLILGLHGAHSAQGVADLGALVCISRHSPGHHPAPGLLPGEVFSSGPLARPDHRRPAARGQGKAGCKAQPGLHADTLTLPLAGSRTLIAAAKFAGHR